MSATLYAHLASGATTVCRAWAVRRRDGVMLGFTDHDQDLSFEGMVFRADTGMTAGALQQNTGLSVDNTEAIGALSSSAVTEGDLAAGRYDGAEVRAWLVNWADVRERVLQFRGSLGEITRAGGAFRSELRGLTEALNQPQGRVYQNGCSAILGDGRCRFNLLLPGFSAEVAVGEIAERRLFRFGALSMTDRWFEAGRLSVLDGAAKGMIGIIKSDRLTEDGRTIELWERIGPEIMTGDRVRLEPGCDKTASTCRSKFSNFRNFRGFPHIPGEDWLISYPVSAGVNDGGSLS
ncbi:MAG: hypothetical protein DI533_03560 [Cereibacter sphaeroides]|uniref:Bacteriophage phiJL001 Gp84 C-terminal domain-containing protein n=1 Tax=Cereibacter sphaeroides TaxID=1063 RepID=A0A2W5S9Q0_CERSP|nr:MAG: hypothetical protein DI533_03560 [Cereibacter sphaeroides]